MSAAARAVVQAVALLHEEGFELLRAWVVARSEHLNFGQAHPGPSLFANVHLYIAGQSPRDVVDFECDHFVFSLSYYMNANMVVDGRLQPDFDTESTPLKQGGWYAPDAVAAYLKQECSLLADRWRGSDASYAAWFRPLAQRAQAGTLPVMQAPAPLPPEVKAVMVAPYAPNHEEPLFPLLGRKK